MCVCIYIYVAGCVLGQYLNFWFPVCFQDYPLVWKVARKYSMMFLVVRNCCQSVCYATGLVVRVTLKCSMMFHVFSNYWAGLVVRQSLENVSWNVLYFQEPCGRWCATDGFMVFLVFRNYPSVWYATGRVVRQSRENVRGTWGSDKQVS